MPKNVSQATLNNIMKIQAELAPIAKMTPDLVEEAARRGLSKHVICGLYKRKVAAIEEDPDLLDAFNKGRAECGQLVRAGILDHALVDNSLQALMYLDKIYGGDTVVQQVQMNVTASPLETVSDAQLLEIDLNEDTDK